MEKLTIQEEQIMQAVWKVKDGFVKDFIAALKVEIPYTTVASIIKNLEKKQFLLSTKVGNAYKYSPKVSADTYNNHFMENVVEHYFDHSYKNLVNYFVEQEKLDINALEEIISLIKKGKNG